MALLVNIVLYSKSLKQLEWTGGVPKVDGVRSTTPGQTMYLHIIVSQSHNFKLLNLVEFCLYALDFEWVE